MTTYIVTCKTINCENENIPIEVPAHIVNGVEIEGMNAICGVCSISIISITKK